MARCVNCGFESLPGSSLCSNCGRALETASAGQADAQTPARGSLRKSPTGWIVLAVLLCGMLFFLLGFHVVTDIPLVVAKDGLTFKDTFLTTGEYVDRYNKAPAYEKLTLSETNLHRALVRRRIIGTLGPDGVPRAEDEGLTIQRPETAPLIESSALHSAYQRNELNADKEYKGKWLVVAGKIAEIDTDFEGKPVVSLYTGESYRNIECRFDQSERELVAQLWKGQHVQILGLCGGGTDN